MLIHGYNNDKDAASRWYDVARDSVRRRAPDAAFLDVFWENWTNGSGIGPWDEGQYIMPTVGVAFRRVVNQLAALTPTIPVRVLTHSLGGPLIANTFGDASAPFPRPDGPMAPDDSLYYARAGLDSGVYRPPRLTDLRVGMLAPAGSGDTFQKYANGTAGPPWRLILGYSPNDFALTKGPAGCILAGVTCLGSSRFAVCDLAVDHLSSRPEIGIHVIDFASPNNKKRKLLGVFPLGDDHDAREYFRRDATDAFLTALLSDVPPAGSDARSWCNNDQDSHGAL